MKRFYLVSIAAILAYSGLASAQGQNADAPAQVGLEDVAVQCQDNGPNQLDVIDLFLSEAVVEGGEFETRPARVLEIVLDFEGVSFPVRVQHNDHMQVYQTSFPIDHGAIGALKTSMTLKIERGFLLSTARSRPRVSLVDLSQGHQAIVEALHRCGV